MNDIPGHSVPLAGLGGFILIFGFLAFNGGSQVEDYFMVDLFITKLMFDEKEIKHLPLFHVRTVHVPRITK